MDSAAEDRHPRLATPESIPTLLPSRPVIFISTVGLEFRSARDLVAKTLMKLQERHESHRRLEQRDRDTFVPGVCPKECMRKRNVPAHQGLVRNRAGSSKIPPLSKV